MIGAILRRGHIEPVFVLLLSNLFFSGLTLLAASATPVLSFPRPFGVAYLCLATVGACGLFGRDNRLKAAFGFVGLFLRLWMAARFVIFNWQDPDWVGFLVGAGAYGWIAARSSCRHVWLETRNQSSDTLERVDAE